MHVGDPIAQRLVHGVFQRPGAARHRVHLRLQHMHAGDVRLLALHVRGAHENLARQAEARTNRRHRDAVLARTGLGDDARLAHALGEQDLAEAVVDLVTAGVIELVALQVDLRAAEVLGEALGEIQGARTSGVVRVEVIELRLERRIGLRLVVRLLQIEDQRHQCLGDKAAAENAEVPPFIGPAAERVEFGVFRFIAGRRHY